MSSEVRVVLAFMSTLVLFMYDFLFFPFKFLLLLFFQFLQSVVLFLFLFHIRFRWQLLLLLLLLNRRLGSFSFNSYSLFFLPLQEDFLAKWDVFLQCFLIERSPATFRT